jgi:putative phage-type endonuclease
MTDCKMQSARRDNCVVICDQHSADGTATEAWLNARKGCVTASNVHKIMGIKGEPSKSTTRDTYLYQLVAERLTGSVTEHPPTAAMKRGIEYEPDARRWYANRYGEVREVGFVFLDADKREAGCSPDGLVEDTDRGLELKVLMPPGHCRMLRKYRKSGEAALEAQHRLQVQYCMWVTGLPRWDLVYYEPPTTNLPVKVIEMQADEKLHAKFAEVVGAFCAEIKEVVETIKEEDDGRNRSIDRVGQRENRNRVDATERPGPALAGCAGENRLF